ncbi:MAG: shikimate dehydrogenase [Cellulomonadaceae bacterium]
MTTPSRAAVLGHPVAHSLSPVLHRAAYAALGLDWTYDVYDVTEDDLGSFVAACDERWAGLSLTMPLKQVALGLLDHVEPMAELVGAVNTLLFQPGPGRPVLVGANTDVYGIVAALREGLDHRAVQGGSAVVLGAGATASSAIAALGELGYTSPQVFARSLARTGAVRRAAHRMGLTPGFHPIAAAGAALGEADLVISTVPAPGDGEADVLTQVRGAGVTEQVRGVLLDVVYWPRPTALATAWAAAGGTAVGGERMLLHQAVEQVRLMTGHAAPVEAMATALDEHL